MFNKKIASEFALGIIVILALALGGFLWWQGRQELNGTEKMINTAPDRKIKESEENKQIVSSGIEEAVLGWQTYRNEKYGFEVNYPISYSYKEYITSDTPFQDFVVSFGSNAKKESKVFSNNENINISIKKFEINDNKNILVEPNGMDVASRNDMIIRGEKAKKYTSSSGGISYVVAKNNFRYELDYTENNESIKNLLDQILSTFKFLN